MKVLCSVSHLAKSSCHFRIATGQSIIAFAISSSTSSEQSNPRKSSYIIPGVIEVHLVLINKKLPDVASTDLPTIDFSVGKIAFNLDKTLYAVFPSSAVIVVGKSISRSLS